MAGTLTHHRQNIEGVYIAKWLLANGQAGDHVELPQHADRSVQVTGTFGSGGSVSIQGSNDPDAPSNWTTLTDTAGNALTLTATGLKQVLQATRWIRANCTAGDGTTALVVTLLLRKAN